MHFTFIKCTIFVILILVAVGHSAPKRVRAGAQRGPRGAAAAAVVELIPAVRTRWLRPARCPRLLLPSARALLHRALPLSPGQHLWLPCKYISHNIFTDILIHKISFIN